MDAASLLLAGISSVMFEAVRMGLPSSVILNPFGWATTSTFFQKRLGYTLVAWGAPSGRVA